MSACVSIVGMGMVSSLGLGVEETFERMLRGEVGMRPITRFPLDGLSQTTGGQLADDVEAKLLERFGEDDLTWGLILRAAEEALGRSLSAPPAPDPQLGLILATNFGIMETLAWCWQERLDTGELDEATFDIQQDVVREVARKVGAGGPAAQLSLSCASGAAALHVASTWLRNGRATRVLAIGYDVLSEYTWTGLANLRTITEKELRPFDKARSGTLFSEGAAAMLLSTRPEDETDALAFLAGSATNNNAFHLTAPPKGAAGSRLVMEAALADANVPASDVSFVSAHATGTSANDPTESAAISALLPKRVPVGAFKSCLGHLLGAAGLTEAVISVCALRQGTIPPIANLTDQDAACDLDAVRDAPRTGNWQVALTNSAGIGGNNSSVVVTRSRHEGQGANAPRPVALARCGWVLPGSVGGGTALPSLTDDDLLGHNEELAEFSVKGYIHSVKGYLDNASKYTLGAAALCLEGIDLEALDRSRFAVVAVTQYGAPGSGFAFYRQMLEKGHRYASPMIFPHSYANTAPNLVAIEFGLSGPHMVFNNAEDISAGWWYARHLVEAGDADHVLLLATEATSPELLPDGRQVLNGALAWLFQAGEGSGVPTVAEAVPGNRHGTVYTALHP